jgi:hypothetical protein
LKTPRNRKLAENEDSQKIIIPRILIEIRKLTESTDFLMASKAGVQGTAAP